MVWYKLEVCDYSVPETMIKWVLGTTFYFHGQKGENIFVFSLLQALTFSFLSSTTEN